MASELNPKAQVHAQHPNARAVEHLLHWAIYEGGRVLGTGRTEERAWNDAKHRLNGTRSPK